MATAIYVPRINNNDDEVKVLAFDVGVGDKIKAGQIVGQVETDKAVLDVTASSDGYVLGFCRSGRGGRSCRKHHALARRV
jgi:pyruvate/2-oxoglutarate dehydrogenase complex dihydrolipoamide acyltransferase (E2) component